MRVLALLSLAFCGVWALEHPAGWRLIRVSEEIEFWASPEQINSLAVDDVGFVDVTDIPDLEMFGATHRRAAQSYPLTPAHEELVSLLIGDVNVQNFLDTLKIFSGAGGWHTRHAHSEEGVVSATWLRDQVADIIASTGVGNVTTFTNPQFGQFNVLAHIDGDGSDDNIVIIGAHQDSIAGGVSATAPGADDDGSGSMMILEVFRIVAERIQSGEFRPKRPIEFHWYAGEEGGLVGSRNQAADYSSRGVPVYSMFQFDMIGYPGTFATPIGVVTDYTDAALTQFLRLLIDSYLSEELGWQDRPCGYGCSDHASWTSAGYPSVFPFEAPFGSHNPRIHTIGDTIENGVDANRVEQFTHLGISYLVEASLA